MFYFYFISKSSHEVARGRTTSLMNKNDSNFFGKQRDWDKNSKKTEIICEINGFYMSVSST